MALSDESSLLFRIRSDSSAAEADIKRFTNSLISDVHSAGEEGVQGFGKIGNALTALEGPAAVAAIAVAGIGIAAIEVADKLFQMTEAAAQTGTSFAKFQNITGLAASSISALNFAAELSGKTLTDVTRPLNIFTAQLSKGSDESTKLGKTLHDLGVTDFGNLDHALAQAIDGLNKMQDGVAKMDAASQLFGRRGGPDMLNLIKKMPEGFSEFIVKAQELGVVLSQNDIQAAEAFHHALETVSLQVKLAADRFALAYGPQITSAIESISEFLAANQGKAQEWGRDVSNVVGGVKDVFSALASVSETVLPGLGTALTANIEGWNVWKVAVADAVNVASAGIPALLQALDRIHTLTHPNDSGEQNGPFASDMTKPPILGTGTATPEEQAAFNAKQLDNLNDAFTKAAEEAAKARDDAYKKEIEDQKQHVQLLINGLRESFKDQQAEREREFKGAAISDETYRNQSLEAIKKYVQAARTLLNGQYVLDSKGVTPTEDSNLKLQRDNAMQAVYNDAAKQKAAVNKAISDQEKQLAEATLKTAKETYDADVQSYTSAENAKRAQAIQTATERVASNADQARISEQYDEDILQHKLAAAKTYRDVFATDTAAYKKASVEVQVLEDQIEQQRAEHATNEHKRNTQAEKDLDDLVDATRQLAAEEHKRRAEEDLKAAQEQGRQVQGTGASKGGVLGGLGLRLPSLLDDKGVLKQQGDYIKSVYNDVAATAGQAIGSMVDGLGNLLEQWLTTGKFSAKAALQMASSIAISLALQAGVKAIMSLADGWAYSALAAANWWNPLGASYATAAAASYTAAGIYGTVAGVAGAIGVGTGLLSRGMSDGTSTAATSASSGVSSSTSRTAGGGGVYSSQPDQTIDGSRNTPGKTLGTVKIQIGLDRNGLLEHLRSDVKNNGPIGSLIIDTAGRA